MNYLLESILLYFIYNRDKKIGINEIKGVFASYLDIPISDADIMEFI